MVCSGAPLRRAIRPGVLDRAEFNDGRNRHVDFRACLFFFTSNLGSRESLHGHDRYGFAPSVLGEQARARHYEGAALRALKRHFPPEFLRRIEETVVFHPLRPADLEQILDLELSKMARAFRDHATQSVELNFCSSAKSLLLQH